jgi:hypothetical protein
MMSTRVERVEAWEHEATMLTSAAVAEILAAHGFKSNPRIDDGVPKTIAFTGGSQLKMRFLGSWFVNPQSLPKRALVKQTPVSSRVRTEIRLEESQGIGIIDARVREKYQREFQSIIIDLQRLIRSSS